ncbi:MAG: hypothetical protein JNK56_11920, partial [Myxococcales bacterium]|nr:hypothetical protein [Myxococcales bacterium]
MPRPPAPRLRWTLGLLLAACKPAPEPRAQTPDPAAPREPAPEAPPSACHDAPCWLAAAGSAEVAGQLDVASACRGRAFASDPTPARLLAWIAGMRQHGEWTRARDSLTAARL